MSQGRAIGKQPRNGMQISCLTPQFHVYAVDMRGHGRSDQALPSTVPHEPCPVSDVLTIIAQLGLERPLVFGHSLGGVVAIEAEVRRPGTWAAIFAFEPVIPGFPHEVCTTCQLSTCGKPT